MAVDGVRIDLARTVGNKAAKKEKMNLFKESRLIKKGEKTRKEIPLV